MKILITGAKGQLGTELIRSQVPGIELIGVGRSEMDVTDETLVRTLVHDMKPDAIIHTAAYTAVDMAESHPDDAYRINVMGTRNVAVAAEEVGARLCYTSTDYVFDGTVPVPYDEYDNTNPQTVYGKTKRAGEMLVQGLCSRWFIVRTSWVYGAHGSNFVKTMLTRSKELTKMRVVQDQIGSPTYTRDLADLLLNLVSTNKYGIYHASNTGQCSWYEFARAIFNDAGIQTPLEPCTTDEFPRPAPRPQYSVLGHTALRANGFTLLRPWRQALSEFLEEIRE